MQHRHLNATTWSRAAVDSALEYGDLPDWRELFANIREDRHLAETVLAIAQAHRVVGSSAMAESLIRALWPDLTESQPSAEGSRSP